MWRSTASTSRGCRWRRTRCRCATGVIVVALTASRGAGRRVDRPGAYLLGTVVIIMLIGTAYSVPPLRLKRYSFWAAISIALARGVIANVGVALHYNDVYGGLTGLLAGHAGGDGGLLLRLRSGDRHLQGHPRSDGRPRPRDRDLHRQAGADNGPSTWDGSS